MLRYSCFLFLFWLYLTTHSYLLKDVQMAWYSTFVDTISIKDEMTNGYLFTGKTTPRKGDSELMECNRKCNGEMMDDCHNE